MPLLIADTGVRSHTKEVVTDVRKGWKANKEIFEQLFDGCGTIADKARDSIAYGDLKETGRLMSANHALLINMTVSSPELNHLVNAAMQAGAYGAKLSGAGRGGNMIALVSEHTEIAVRAALFAAGARTVLSSHISS